MSPRRLGPASIVRLLGAWRGGRAGPAYRQLADNLRLLILDGRLPLDVVLPGERELAQVLEVSRTTVTAAFAHLRDDGFLDRRQGAGARTRLPAGPGERGASTLTDTPDVGLLDLTMAAPPAGDVVHPAFVAALSRLPAHLPLHGYGVHGPLELRQVLAERYSQRGLPTTPDQIMITNGAQHGLALMIRLLAGPGDRVVIDHPTYPHAIDAIQRASCRAVPVGLPGEGWDADGVAAALRQSAPRLAYLIPEFHNPTGRWMDLEARAAIAHAAAQTRTTVIFDETLIDLWQGAPPDPYGFEEPADALVRLFPGRDRMRRELRPREQARARPARELYAASAPPIQALIPRRASIDLGSPLLEQLAAVHLLSDDTAHLAARRTLLQERCRHLIGALAERLPDWRVAAPPGGLSLWAELPAPVSTALAATSERFGVRIASGTRFGVDGAFDRFVRIPFTLAPDDLTEAVRRLAQAYVGLRPIPTQAQTSIGAVV